MNSKSPLLGFNNNVRHKGRVFHIQTEDSGVRHPHVITHLFADGGRILKTTKTTYAEHVSEPNMVETVTSMMKRQHKAMFIALRDGEFDHLFKSSSDAIAAAVTIQPAPAPADPAVADTAPVPPPPAVASPFVLADSAPAAPTTPAAASVAPIDPLPLAPTVPPTAPPLDPSFAMAITVAPAAPDPSPPSHRPAAARPASAPGRSMTPTAVPTARFPGPAALPRHLTPPSFPSLGARPTRPVPAQRPTHSAPSLAASADSPPSARPSVGPSHSAPTTVPDGPSPARRIANSTALTEPSFASQSPAPIDLDLAALDRAAAEAHTPFISAAASELPPPPAVLLRPRPALDRTGHRDTPVSTRISRPTPSTAPSPASRRPPADSRHDLGATDEAARSDVRGDLAPGRYTMSRPASAFASRPAEGSSIFGEELISEKSLDEVILSYLADDQDTPGSDK